MVVAITEFLAHRLARRPVRLKALDIDAVLDHLEDLGAVAERPMHVAAGFGIGDHGVGNARKPPAGRDRQPERSSVSCNLHVRTAHAPVKPRGPSPAGEPKRQSSREVAVIHPALHGTRLALTDEMRETAHGGREPRRTPDTEFEQRHIGGTQPPGVIAAG